jgi:rod shape-determining protein MreD
MKRFFFIVILTYIFFLVDFLMFNAFGRWGAPNLLLILIVFFNLYLGIRYGLLTAFWAGVLKDSFSTGVFGTHIFLFMSCAFLAIILRRNFYRPGSRLSRLVVTAGVVVAYVLAEALLRSMDQDMGLKDIFQYVFIPEVALTVACATFVFTRLKDLAVRLQL